MAIMAKRLLTSNFVFVLFVLYHAVNPICNEGTRKMSCEVSLHLNHTENYIGCSVGRYCIKYRSI